MPLGVATFSGWHDAAMTLRPLLIARLVSAVPGLCLAGAAVMGWRAGGREAWPLLAGLAILGVVLMVRGYRAAVVCERGAVVVRGVLWTRRVPTMAVTALTSFPALRWQTAAGRRRWTPILAFASNDRALPILKRLADEHNDRCLDRLAAHIKQGGGRVAAAHSHDGARRRRRRRRPRAARRRAKRA
jgi:hypothetical protein